jgi:hypothetical protein
LQNDGAQRVITDGVDNVYIAGYFDGTEDFDPGDGIFTLTANPSFAGPESPTVDAFVLKLNANGQLVWAVSFGGDANDFAYGLALDPNGNVLVSGQFGRTADFDPGPAEFAITAKAGDNFVLKLSSAGQFVWAKRFGGTTSLTYEMDVATDSSGNVYTAGWFSNTIDADPGVGTLNLTSAGQEDVFITKLTATGDFSWAKSLGGPDADKLGVWLLIQAAIFI